jgi:hypothetical protein
METRADHFLKVLENRKPSTNVYLRRVHNFALNMDWILKPVIPRREWPKIAYKKKRPITAEEHRRVIEREGNTERRDFYELLWHLGGSQSDVACLHAEDINWPDGTITYTRRKLASRMTSRINPARIRFGEEVAEILKRRPATGPLFPHLQTIDAKYRATEFQQRRKGLGITGVTLHSYRYAWAERARACGYPMRFAQEALGHNSKALHDARTGEMRGSATPEKTASQDPGAPWHARGAGRDHGDAARPENPCCFHPPKGDAWSPPRLSLSQLSTQRSVVPDRARESRQVCGNSGNNRPLVSADLHGILTKICPGRRFDHTPPSDAISHYQRPAPAYSEMGRSARGGCSRGTALRPDRR